MDKRDFMSSRELARITGLPKRWLEREAAAGRIPSIRAGRRLMFDVNLVRAALARIQGAGGADVSR